MLPGATIITIQGSLIFFNRLTAKGTRKSDRHDLFFVTAQLRRAHSVLCRKRDSEQFSLTAMINCGDDDNRRSLGKENKGGVGG